MLMVIFGAGASYDSSPDFPPPSRILDPREYWRPPLANQLFLDSQGAFGDIVQRYDRLRPILPRLRQPEGNRSLEEQLEFFQNEAKSDPERTRQLFSVRYYLHELFREISREWLKRTSHVSNYAELLDQIRHSNTTKEPVCLVTFNYDLLLDDALRSFDFVKPISVENIATAHPIFKFFKPHGSADWARLVADSAGLSRPLPQSIIARADEIKLSDSFVIASPVDPHQMFQHKAPIVPAIAIPVQNKYEDTFEWPRHHRDLFVSLLPSVTKILIVGWKAKEAHFLKLLRENLPTGGITQIRHLQVVAANQAEARSVCEQFRADVDRRVWKVDYGPDNGGFSTFVRQGSAAFLFKE